MSDVLVCAPSYRRPDAVLTLAYLPSCRIYVSSDEADAYRAANPEADIVEVPPNVQGNVARIRNHILDREFRDGRAVLIVDDDLLGVYLWQRGERAQLETEAEVLEFVAKYTDLAREWGCPAWGVNVNWDGQAYHEMTPFSLTCFVGAPFTVHVSHRLRYDERLSLKEDYDFTLQLLNAHRKILRVNRASYRTLQMAQPGGCATYRNMDAEREQVELLRRKWGARIVRAEALSDSRNKRATKVRKLDLNPVIVPPIRGV